MDGKEIIKALYDKDYVFFDENAKEFNVPLEGSLGLLAEGYRGIIALRKQRNKNSYKNQNELIIGSETKPEKK